MVLEHDFSLFNNNGIFMNIKKHLLFISMFSAVSVAQAASAPLIDSILNSKTVYAGTYVSTGATSAVGGNIQSISYTTLGATAKVGGAIESGAHVALGANSTVGGDVTAEGYATLGATTIPGNVMVGGDVTSGAAITVGVKSAVTGDLTTGAAASVTLGSESTVGGNATAGINVVLGADADIGGNATGGSGTVTLGERSVITGDATAGTVVQKPISASVGGDIIEGLITMPPIATTANVDQTVQLTTLQTTLKNLTAPAANELGATMGVDTTLESGVYHATAMTTAADITLTLDGKGEDSFWLFNIDSYIAFGANLTIDLLNVTDNSAIIWNSGSYTSLGAGSNLIGAVFASSYISGGAGSKLTGVGDACGGIFSTNSYISLGATNVIGREGCTPGAITPTLVIDDFGGPIFASVTAVPVPAAAFLFAPALLGFMGLRRKAKNSVA
jgi:MSHA biogenesis protein MshQ